MNKLLSAGGNQSARDLQGDVQRDGAVDRSFVVNPLFDGLAFNQFHGVKVFLALAAEVKNRCDVAVAQLGGGARFGQKARPAGCVGEIARMDHLERDFATQGGIERLVGDAHGTAAEFNWLAITAIDELILVKTPWPASPIKICAAQRSVQQAGKTKLFRTLG